MIELNGVSKIYKDGGTVFYALKSIDLKITDSEFVSICGRSGSGKTTLLNIIGTLDKFNSGTYYLDGNDIGKMCDREKSHLRNEKIGFVLQDFALIDYQTVLYNVMLPLLYSKIPFSKTRRKAEKMLNEVGLEKQIRKRVSQLSGGQKQRVAIARALVNDPSVILADEPTGQLDRATSVEIMQLLKEINSQGRTLIIVTHDEKVAALADRIITISDGKIVK